MAWYSLVNNSVCLVLLGKLTLSELIGASPKVSRSGCSTFLKTIAGETHGFQVSADSYLNYQGVPASEMNTIFRGEAVYTAEVDAHFPQLSVGDTLYFAALARAPRILPGGVTREQYAAHLRDVSTDYANDEWSQLTFQGCHGHVRYRPYCQHPCRQRLRSRSQWG
jgi:hypothetical protein